MNGTKLFVQYKEGDLVLTRFPKNRRPSKLQWNMGPLKVIEKQGTNIYLCENPSTGKRTQQHGGDSVGGQQVTICAGEEGQ